MPRSTLSAALLVAGLGVAIGLAANAISPRGLSLTRNYFPDTGAAATPPAAAASAATAAPTASAPVSTTKRGLPLIDHARAAELFRDPRHAQGLVMFVDARNEEVYRQGHIPGAHLLDHYRVDRYLAELIAPALLAEQIVVYCNGGDCEDSELAAFDLMQVGVSQSKVLIYAGGINEWKNRREPLELDTRGSGKTPAP